MNSCRLQVDCSVEQKLRGLTLKGTLAVPLPILAMGGPPPRGSLGGWFVMAGFLSFEALVYSYDFGTHEPHTVDVWAIYTGRVARGFLLYH